MSLQVQLQQFEGPLALLLYLIRKEEMDVMNINIHEITQQYLEYIKVMKELDLEVAGEFIAMASTLIHIKSRLLLPQYNEHGEIVESEDPRKELVQKLIEYQKYQEAAKLLYERPLVGRDMWLRGSRETLEVKDDEILLEDNALFALISSYRQAMKAMKKKVHKVAQKIQSIAARILEMREKLIVGQRTLMSELITVTEERSKQVLITFLSLLELGKLGFVRLYQTDTYGEIYIDTTKPIEGDAVSRVEEYDNMNAEDVARDMMAKAQKVESMDEFMAPSSEEESAQLSLSITDEALSGEAGSEFVLHDGEENIDVALQEFIDGTELATDEEILAAENEMMLEGNHEQEA